MCQVVYKIPHLDPTKDMATFGILVSDCLKLKKRFYTETTSPNDFPPSTNDLCVVLYKDYSISGHFSVFEYGHFSFNFLL